MQNDLSIAGPAGQVKWGYQVVAELGPWSIRANSAGGGSLTADVVTSDAFRLSQGPLTFVVPRPMWPWVWPVQSLQVAGRTLTASLGPQE